MTSTTNQPTEFDVIVIGAGHAGCEAALAAARAGTSVLCVTPNADRIGFMPCNPSIGGPGKSHIVAEVDALGGAMAEVADATAVQARKLNTSKGPAVQAIRLQVDKTLYAMAMKRRLEEQPGLTIAQDEAIGIAIGSHGPAAVELRGRGLVRCRSVVVTAGTFLRGAMVSGDGRISGGRAGDSADEQLASSLSSLGIRTRRFKTGTPPRIDGRTVDVSQMETQPGDDAPIWMSRKGRTGQITPIVLPVSEFHRPFARSGWRTQIACHRIGTNPAVHELIRSNLDRAPMFNGSIEGVGPRYCPSIEDKVARFTGKDEHPIFLEPEGWQTNELYVQGMSTSLPADVQLAALRLIPGLERVAITRFGYAVEYDAVDANELLPTLESKSISGVFLAGQVNGTSGYEEAAGQGLLAGLNAARTAQDLPHVTIPRTMAYVGVMIDDLVSLPFAEPYRMLTARAEFRLLLRPDTAEFRMSKLATDTGLVDRERASLVTRELDLLRSARQVFVDTVVKPNSETDRALQAVGQVPVVKPMPLADLMRRPSLSLRQLVNADPSVAGAAVGTLPHHLVDQFETDLKYASFVEREQREVNRMQSLDHHALPNTRGVAVPGLRNEARQQLERFEPKTYGDAQRIAGVTAADLAALLIHATRTDHAQP